VLLINHLPSYIIVIMKVSGIIILLVGTVAMGANAQVLKGTASSSNPRRRFNKMKEADRRRLQTTQRTNIPCLDIDSEGEDGYGKGCRQEAGPVICESDGECSSQNLSYRECYDKGDGFTNTCVCIIPTDGGGNQCTHGYGKSGARPCCYDGKYI
jgi:hypothetical protein